MSGSEWLQLASIPVFTGAIGWLINWSGVLMLFNPVRFHGITVPGMRELSTLLPRRLQEIPGIMQGGIGWQGIVPARAAKMGSIAVDKAIAKLGTPAEFYQQLEPEKIAEHIVRMFQPQVPELVDDIMRREQPELWARVPPRRQAGRLRAASSSSCRASSARSPTRSACTSTSCWTRRSWSSTTSPKNPALVNKIFRDFGQKELNLMVNFGFIFGFLLGIPVAVHRPHAAPVVAAADPRRDRRLDDQPARHAADLRAARAASSILGIKFHGLFLRRQDEAAEVYAQIIADDVVTLENIGNFLLDGPRGDRTQADARDRAAAGDRRRAGPGARRRPRGDGHARVRHRSAASVAAEAVGHTLTPFQDAEFSRQQSERIRKLIAAAHQGAAAGGLRRDDARGDQGG